MKASTVVIYRALVSFLSFHLRSGLANQQALLAINLLTIAFHVRTMKHTCPLTVISGAIGQELLLSWHVLLIL